MTMKANYSAGGAYINEVLGIYAVPTRTYVKLIELGKRHRERSENLCTHTHGLTRLNRNFLARSTKRNLN
jgi:hypothetical protein